MAIAFKTLWDKHPSPDPSDPSSIGDNEPCKRADGTASYENQCAIRMGVALWKSGLKPDFSVRTCRKAGHEGHALSAEEVGRWIARRKDLFGFRKIYYSSSKPLSKIKGKKGIVLCIDFWGDDGRGDHIDVWNISMMKHGDPTYVEMSQGVWFWELP